MGEVRVDVLIRNLGDRLLAGRGLIPQGEVRELVESAVVDTGATVSALPVAVVERLGLEIHGSDIVELADGVPHQLSITEPVEFVCMGRNVVEQCVVLGDDVLLGQIFLEFTDLFVDAKNRRLVGNPEHPDRRVHKVRLAIG